MTRRTVKGAAGGMLGVDYEDTRRPEHDPGPMTKNAGRTRAGAPGAAAAPPTQGGPGQGLTEPSAGNVRGENEIILDDEDLLTRDEKAKVNRRKIVARDRLTVDKDAPELRRYRRLLDQEEEEEDDDDGEAQGWNEPDELDLEALGEWIASASDDVPIDRAALFGTSRRPTVGDPTLTDPQQIMTAFGSPHAYAKHAMILAEAFRSATGALRPEAIAYLARLLVGAPERPFGRAALRELLSTTGIGDLYPLEVLEHILEYHPAFLPKAAFGPLFSDRALSATPRLRMQCGEEELLKYNKTFRVRGFAMKGGHRPGYAFWPAKAPGHYLLRIDYPGRYTLLVSGLSASGYTVVDRLIAVVTGDGQGGGADPRPATRPRDAARIAAWPMPVVVDMDPLEVLDPHAGRPKTGLLDAGEIGRRQQLDALRGPKGDSGALPVVNIDASVLTKRRPLARTEPKRAEPDKADRSASSTTWPGAVKTES